MKNFLLELLGITIVSFVAVPLAIIGLCIGSALCEEKVVPWLNKN